MGMKSATNYTSGTTRVGDIKMEELSNCFAAQDRKLSYELGRVTLCLSGENLKTIADKQESTAPSSETKANINQASLSDRLMQSLISAGLVKGTIPMSMRVKSNQSTLDTVLKWQDGDNAE